MNRGESSTRSEPTEGYVGTGQIRDRQRRQSLANSLLHVPVRSSHGRRHAQHNETLSIELAEMLRILDERLIGIHCGYSHRRTRAWYRRYLSPNFRVK